ncbi:MAG: restriction endonuclease subunit S, partial [Thermodesulfobacteriota bacterium]|nr:restriction endonuclease subunit S [Thermodesulfobacteriota bacterium]
MAGLIKGFNLSRKYPKNSILFTCIGSTIGKSGIADIELTSNQQINAIFPNNTFDSDYLYYLLNLLANKIKQGAGETAVPIINKTEFGELSFPLPPTKAEQTAIATALNDADALITQLEKLIAKKRAIKQGAMQELLKPKEGWEV